MPKKTSIYLIAIVFVGGNASSEEVPPSAERPGPVGGSPQIYSRPGTGSGGDTNAPSCIRCITEPLSEGIWRCKATVSGKIVFEYKSCTYSDSESRIYITAGSKYDYYVKIELKNYESGTGVLLNRKSKIKRDLGTLNKEGDCWVNEKFRVCAWLKRSY